LPQNINAELLTASAAGDAARVEELLGQGANIETRDADGHTAISLAAHEGHIGVMELLIQKGANINARSGNGTTPLISSIDSHNLDAVKLLLKKGEKGDIPLFCCFERLLR